MPISTVIVAAIVVEMFAPIDGPGLGEEQPDAAHSEV